MKVIDLDISDAEMLEKYTDCIRNAGFSIDENDKDLFLNELKDISRIAGSFPVGTILEKRGNKFQNR
jgi:hypothetical protein